MIEHDTRTTKQRGASIAGRAGSKTMNYIITAVTGILFGLGLSISQMVDRQRVLGFLTLTGDWDPTLAFVMGSAVAVTIIAFRFVLRQPRPVLDVKFHLPRQTQIDARLIAGAAIFGIGWGISGYCPGPGVAALVQGQWNPVLFVAAFVFGSFCCESMLRHVHIKPRRLTEMLVESKTTGESA